MIGRRAVVRRRPLLRTAAVGGMGYMAGRAAAGRSDEMDHAQQQQQYAQQQQQQYAQEPRASGTPGPSAADQLSQLNALYQQGALTDEEFAAAKAKILGG